jgi:cytochrome c biogenesis protein
MSHLDSSLDGDVDSLAEDTVTTTAATTALATAPADANAAEDRREAPRAPRRLIASPVRWWRQLTSMRTALVLLFLLALAAVPGTTFPQRPLNPAKVEQYLADHPSLGPVLDRVGAFDVFGSPWFAAIYLLLFVSLVGCLVPRVRMHARAMLRRPPAAPRHLDRLPVSARLSGAVGPAETAETAATIRSVLRRSRWRTVVRAEPSGAVAVSGERGYLRETGNLAFHLALVAVLVGVASGALWGWKASALVVEGGTFCDTAQAFDQFTPGRRVRDAALPPFCLTLDDFRATYLPSGQPTSFTADVRYVDGARAEVDDPDRRYRLQVNEPLRVEGANVHLINHGYAPVLRYTDRYGTVFEDAPPFLPQDDRLTSEGAFLLPDANQDPRSTTTARGVQMAFTGFFLPSAPLSGPPIRSTSPEPTRPAVTLLAYRGDTGLNSGIPRSVYSVDQEQVERGALKPLASRQLFPGDAWRLDDGSTLEFVGVREFVTLQVGHDPGDRVVLGGAAVMLVGLVASLVVRRRRIWFRVGRDGTITAGGLARTDAERYAEEFRRACAAVEAAVGSGPPATDRSIAPPARPADGTTVRQPDTGPGREGPPCP